MKQDRKNKEYRIYLCLDTLRHVVANNIVDDILIGCNFGDITGLIDGRILILKEDAHQDSINSIKTTKLSKDVNF